MEWTVSKIAFERSGSGAGQGGELTVVLEFNLVAQRLALGGSSHRPLLLDFVLCLLLNLLD